MRKYEESCKSFPEGPKTTQCSWANPEPEKPQSQKVWRIELLTAMCPKIYGPKKFIPWIWAHLLPAQNTKVNLRSDSKPLLKKLLPAKATSFFLLMKSTPSLAPAAVREQWMRQIV